MSNRRIIIPRVKKAPVIDVIDPIKGSNTNAKILAPGQLDIEGEVLYKNKRELCGKSKWMLVYTIESLDEYAGKVLHIVEFDDIFLTQQNIFEADTREECLLQIKKMNLKPL